MAASIGQLAECLHLLGYSSLPVWQVKPQMLTHRRNIPTNHVCLLAAIANSTKSSCSLVCVVEIGGGWLMWQTIRNSKPWYYLTAGKTRESDKLWKNCREFAETNIFHHQHLSSKLGTMLHASLRLCQINAMCLLAIRLLHAHPRVVLVGSFSAVHKDLIVCNSHVPSCSSRTS